MSTKTITCTANNGSQVYHVITDEHIRFANDALGGESVCEDWYLAGYDTREQAADALVGVCSADMTDADRAIIVALVAERLITYR